MGKLKVRYIFCLDNSLYESDNQQLTRLCMCHLLYMRHDERRRVIFVLIVFIINNL